MIDPEFWTDEEVVLWPFEARLFFLGLLNFADDEGRFVANPVKLKLQIFPNDPVAVDNLMSIVSKKVDWYEVDGMKYGFVRKFKEYQSISHPQPSKLPPPPGQFQEHSRNVHGTFQHNQSNQSNQSSLVQYSLGQSQTDDFFKKGFKTEEIKALTKAITNHLGHPEGSEASREALKEIINRTAAQRGIKSPLAYAIKSDQNLKNGK